VGLDPSTPNGGPATDGGEAAPAEGSPACQEAGSKPAASTTALPKIAEKADDLEAIKKAVDDAAAVGGGLWLSYLFVLFYLAVAAGAVTHADLFLEKPVKLPFLNIELPLLAFFFLAPILFVIVHAYTLVHLVMLTDKAKRFHQALHDKIGDENIRAGLQQQLPSNIFVQFLAGPADVRASAFGWVLRAIAWITLAIAPVLLLLMMQMQFLPYHNSFITWAQRIALPADLMLLWWLWRKILSGRELSGPFRPSWAWPALGLALSLGAVLFSWTVATFPGEQQEEFLVNWDKPRLAVSLHDWVFNSPVDGTTRRRRLPFSNTLVLTGFNVVEGLGIDDPGKAKWRDFVFLARGRDLKGARLDFASLPRVDFTGAHLEEASLNEARLNRASFDHAQLRGARLQGAQLQGASLADGQLQGASLVQAHLQGASLVQAHLQGAFLSGAQLEGASLRWAHLQGASLTFARLQGAWLDDTQLQGANLEGAQLQGAVLDFAEIQGASLAEAWLQGASMTAVQLEGAWLAGARLQGASLAGARLQGASLVNAQLEGALLSYAQLQGASLYGADLHVVDLSNALLWRSDNDNDATLVVPRVPSVFDYVSGQWPPLGAITSARFNRREVTLAALRLPDAPDQWRPVWRVEDDVHLWNDATYLHLRETIESLPPGVLRDQALDRIGRLDCSKGGTSLASCDTSAPEPPKAAAWRKALEDARVDDATYAGALAAELETLVCSGDTNAGYILRGVLGSGRLAATGPEAQGLIDFIMSKDCPVSASLTDADKAKLLRIKQEAIKKAGG